jgi:hypothetical protein
VHAQEVDAPFPLKIPLANFVFAYGDKLPV